MAWSSNWNWCFLIIPYIQCMFLKYLICLFGLRAFNSPFYSVAQSTPSAVKVFSFLYKFLYISVPSYSFKIRELFFFVKQFVQRGIATTPFHVAKQLHVHNFVPFLNYGVTGTWDHVTLMSQEIDVVRVPFKSIRFRALNSAVTGRGVTYHQALYTFVSSVDNNKRSLWGRSLVLVLFIYIKVLYMYCRY